MSVLKIIIQSFSIQKLLFRVKTQSVKSVAQWSSRQESCNWDEQVCSGFCTNWRAEKEERWMLGSYPTNSSTPSNMGFCSPSPHRHSCMFATLVFQFSWVFLFQLARNCYLNDFVFLNQNSGGYGGCFIFLLICPIQMTKTLKKKKVSNLVLPVVFGSAGHCQLSLGSLSIWDGKES